MFIQEIHRPHPKSNLNITVLLDKQNTAKIMEAVRPYFLSPYQDGGRFQKVTRHIDGTVYTVYRPNHGLAHGLRQGALAKDILALLVEMKETYGTLDVPELDQIATWARDKISQDLMHKVEFAASFQRSGRQSECSSAHDLETYKKYERQDAIHFQKAARASNLFRTEEEIKIFAEAILWSNKGDLNEDFIPDLKYLRRILHTAHTFDLRRIPSFNTLRIRTDGIQQLLGKSCGQTPHSLQFENALWNRSGAYLAITGDRDACRNEFANAFFLQTANPQTLVDAIDQVSQRSLWAGNVSYCH